MILKVTTVSKAMINSRQCTWIYAITYSHQEPGKNSGVFKCAQFLDAADDIMYVSWTNLCLWTYRYEYMCAHMTALSIDRTNCNLVYAASMCANETTITRSPYNWILSDRVIVLPGLSSPSSCSATVPGCICCTNAPIIPFCWGTGCPPLITSPNPTTTTLWLRNCKLGFIGGRKPLIYRSFSALSFPAS